MLLKMLSELYMEYVYYVSSVQHVQHYIFFFLFNMTTPNHPYTYLSYCKYLFSDGNSGRENQQMKSTSSASAAKLGEHLDANSQMELVGHSIVSNLSLSLSLTHFMCTQRYEINGNLELTCEELKFTSILYRHTNFWWENVCCSIYGSGL